jgi:hypothetical protein
MGVFFSYQEFENFTQSRSVLLIKPNTYIYSNLALEKATDFVNGLFYSLSLVISIEIFVRASDSILNALAKITKAKLFVPGVQCDITMPKPISGQNEPQFPLYLVFYF